MNAKVARVLTVVHAPITLTDTLAVVHLASLVQDVVSADLLKMFIVTNMINDAFSTGFCCKMVSLV